MREREKSQLCGFEVSKRPTIDSRRDYAPWRQGARLGALWINDWDSPCSVWARRFEQIINCCNKPTAYVNWMYHESQYLICLPTFPNVM